MPRLLDTARELAKVGPSEGLCLSVFLDLDPTVVPTRPALATHVGSLVDQARRAVTELPDSLGHDAVVSVREDVDRVAAFLEGEFDRAGARGEALFVASAPQVWREVRLPVAVDDGVNVDRAFVLAPLLPAIERDRELVLAAVSRERGTIWRRLGGTSSLLDDRTEPIQSRHDQGGWSQANYARSRDKDADDHLREVAEALSRTVEPGSATFLVVACPNAERSALERHLAPHARDALIGWASVEAHDDGTALAAEAESMLSDRLRDEHRRLLEQWHLAAGRDGRAAAGWDDVMGAVWDGAVETLLVDGSTRDAWECPTCGRGSATPGTCVVEGSALEEREGAALDQAVRGTLRFGGEVRLLEPADLGEAHGVAALLRYP